MTADAAPTSDSDYAQHFIEQAMPLLDQLYCGARRLTASRFDAEDLVQETMLSGFKGFRRYREGTNLRAWLFRIMYNTGSAAIAPGRAGRPRCFATNSTRHT